MDHRDKPGDDGGGRCPGENRLTPPPRTRRSGAPAAGSPWPRRPGRAGSGRRASAPRRRSGSRRRPAARGTGARSLAGSSRRFSIRARHQQVPEGVGVDIEGRVHEVADIGPPVLVSIVELDRRARGSRPSPPSRSRRCWSTDTSPCGPLVVEAGLEAVEGDLAHHGVQPVLDAPGQQAALLLFRGGRPAAGRRSGPRRRSRPSRPGSGACRPAGCPEPPARVWCTPWPSSWARVSTSRRSPIQFRNT